MKTKKLKKNWEVWLRIAQDDLLWAKDSLRDKWYSRACFIAQQVAEKAFKSYLFFKKEKLIRTHNLLLLLKRCQKYDQTFDQLAKSCSVLNDYYTDTRYPDIWDITRFENKNLANEALDHAKQIVQFVKIKIKKQTPS